MRTKITQEECSKGGRNAALINTLEQQEEWGRRGGILSGQRRRAKADKLPPVKNDSEGHE